MSSTADQLGKEILEILQFKSTTIRSCLIHSNFHYSFSYCSISHRVGIFSIGSRGVNILVFAPLLHSRLRTSKPKAMNKIISTSDRLFMAVSGPSCCGKTELIFKMLLQNTFSPKFQSIFYFYQHEQQKFESLERKLNIQFKKFISFEVVFLFLMIHVKKFLTIKSFRNLQLQVVTKI